MPAKSKYYTVIPGFGLTLGFAITYLCLVVLIPLGFMVSNTFGMTFEEFREATFSSRAIAAYKLTFGSAFYASSMATIFGTMIAWVLVRYEFPMKNILDAIIDIPFALPTAVAGIALAALYSKSGVIGGWLEPYGISVAYTPNGIVLAMIFISIPFVVRSVEPVLQDFDPEVEEAASSLGATRAQTFRIIILPNITPAILSGFAMAFARALGEYGSIIFIAGNIPMISEIVPLLIVTKLEQYDIAGATAIATVMLAASFVLLFVINTLQKMAREKQGKKT